MGWTAECQRRRWFQYTTHEWVVWQANLLDEGFGRYTRFEWLVWILKMRREHGESHWQGARVRGVETGQSVQSALQDAILLELSNL